MTGTRLVACDDGEIVCEVPSNALAQLIESDLLAVAREESSGVRVYEVEGDKTEVFFETLTPPVSLVVFGAGHDALPVVELSRSMGWQTEVVDTQARNASLTRFALADTVTLARPETVGEQVRITERTLTLVMSHNYSHDLALLKFLLASPARYIGIMGPRKRTERMLSELSESDARFRLDEADSLRLYTPAGLDIGANAPAEIALSIIAEMRAFLAGRRGGMLRERRGAIHNSINDGERVPPVPEADAQHAVTV
jgi:xanthine/CO dehydrogenase XdhC/CoxF family maturation factor